ncbi:MULTISPECIES: TetR family transcriptional regulator [Kitasatospora]|uniref:Putative TetR family transcriptional regulator n=1 Tax=Kitasatospora setae (strain ATCC 33774 / DSM 43861 / JCM 3304 / KCC A-0304 / NBRC 14216 / KM-6054) TaxID=452652 RepID=E4N1P0_KITSK|nr:MULTISPECIES: TetR family transcriptional regulator [Kitasatospora]BAJ32074.1 putative TetR family transcriptional regulator [Kitasatospora setae KM-6054]
MPDPSAPSPTPTSPQSPSLTERRKAATQQEISLAAARLFAEHGAEGTTAEDIARTSGVSLRTFYRYFRTKEDAVAPLLAEGSRQWIELLAATAPGTPPLTALLDSARASLTPAPGRAAESLAWTRGLLRAMPDDPALRDVWHRVHHDAEAALRPVLAGLTGLAAEGLEARLLAAAANTAMRVAVESWAAADTPPTAAADLADTTFRRLAGPLLPPA